VIVQLELLIGREVLDAGGGHAGRIEEVHVNDAGEITEWVLATGRLHVSDWIIFVLHQLGAQKSSWKHSRRVPWQELDLSDPERPRLRTSSGTL
jgi:hypothetical protein